MELFDEITNCSGCLKVEALDDSNTFVIKKHLVDAHRSASTYAYIIAVADRLSAERQWIQSTYDEAKEYLDSNFANGFLQSFESRCWELSVYRYLTDSGITINKPLQSAGPDFDTSIGYVECVAVSRGNGNNAIPLLKAGKINEDGTVTGMEFQEVPTNPTQLRISAVLSEKVRKYEIYSSQPWFDTGKPRIIAVNWYAEGASFGTGSSFDVTRDPMLRTLFGTGPLQLTIDTQMNEVIKQQPVRQLTIHNANGTEIEVHYFAKEPDSEERRIDGVISSEKAPFMYHGHDFRVINNPFGKPINMDAFGIGHKTITKLDERGFSITSK